MAQVINTNVLSLNAQRNLSSSQSTLAQSLQRLSSGLRINSAKDDAAGLAISERFTTQIRGLNQAIRNANDGISLAQTGEAALATVNDNLQRIREIAVQSVNATNSDSDRAALQLEVDQRLAEIGRIANQTSFNGRNLLDGTFGNAQFQIGANVGQTITVELDRETSVRTADIGSVATATTVNLAGLISEGQDAVTAVPASYTSGTIDATSLSNLNFETVPTPTTTQAGGFDGMGFFSSEAGETFSLEIDGLDVLTIESDMSVSGSFSVERSDIQAALEEFSDAQSNYTIDGTLEAGTLVISRLDGADISVTLTNTFGESSGTFTDGLAGLNPASGEVAATSGSTEAGGLNEISFVSFRDGEAFSLQIDGQDVLTRVDNLAEETVTRADIQAALEEFSDAQSNYTIDGTLEAGTLVISRLDGADISVTLTNSFSKSLGTFTGGWAGLNDREVAATNDSTEDTTANATFSVQLGALSETVTLNQDAGGSVNTLASQIQAALSGTTLADVTVTEANGSLVFAFNGTPVDGEFSFTGTNANGTTLVNQITTGGDSTEGFAERAASPATAIEVQGLTITFGSNDPIEVEDGTYNSVQSFVDAVNTALGSNGTALLNSDNELVINSRETITINLGSSTALFTDLENEVQEEENLSNLTVTSIDDANDAIARIDSALTAISNLRSTFGAIQNRFESTIANLSATSENLSAARSRIQDADFAQETAELTRLQILQQAGISVLAQANVAPQSVLALLQ